MLLSRGVMHSLGRGLASDAPAALADLSRADTLGNTRATLFLATCYMNGRGVERDPVKAIQACRVPPNVATFAG